MGTVLGLPGRGHRAPRLSRFLGDPVFLLPGSGPAVRRILPGSEAPLPARLSLPPDPRGGRTPHPPAAPRADPRGSLSHPPPTTVKRHSVPQTRGNSSAASPGDRHQLAHVRSAVGVTEPAAPARGHCEGPLCARRQGLRAQDPPARQRGVRTGARPPAGAQPECAGLALARATCWKQPRADPPGGPLRPCPGPPPSAGC